MVRYLTMRLCWSRLGWGHYYLFIAWQALQCIGTIFSAQFWGLYLLVCGWREISGRAVWAAVPLKHESTLLLSVLLLLLLFWLTWLHWALSPYLSTLLLISLAIHTRRRMISLQEHLHKPHIVNATHLEPSQPWSNWIPIPRLFQARLNSTTNVWTLDETFFKEFKRIRDTPFPISSIWIIIASGTRGVSISQRATRRILPPWYALRILITPTSMDVYCVLPPMPTHEYHQPVLTPFVCMSWIPGKHEGSNYGDVNFYFWHCPFGRCSF